VLLKATEGAWHSEESYPDLTGVTAIAASYDAYTHAMAIVNDSEHEGEVVTWGASELGERGNGEQGFWHKEIENPITHKKEKNPPSEWPRGFAMFAPGLKHIVAVAVGGDDDFALQEVEGKTKLYAWGENKDGRLGLGTYEGPDTCDGEGEYKTSCATRPTEVDLPAGVKVTAISGGKLAAYAVLSNGKVLSWGENEWGQLGRTAEARIGSTKPSRSDVPGYVCAVGVKPPCTEYLQGIKTVAAGAHFALAVTESGGVVGWGANKNGQLTGESSEKCNSQKSSKTECQLAPKVVTGVEDVTAAAAGGGYSIVLSGGTVYGFGDGELGQLGIGEQELESCEKAPCSRVPLKVEGLAPVGGIAASEGEPNETHVLSYVESGPGPAPEITATPEPGGVKVVWNIFKSEPVEFQLGWQLATRWEVEAKEEGNGEEEGKGKGPEEEETAKEKEEKEKAKKEQEKREEEEEAKETKGPVRGPETCENIEKPCEETIEGLEPKSYEASIDVLKLQKGTKDHYVESGSIKFQSVTPLEL
jgi:alpha-tubulin suppressor-like RCC1 family protein